LNKEEENKRLQIVISKTNVSKEQALKHLSQNNFDINLTLKSLEEELYSVTERIFRKFKSKETVLSNVLTAVEMARSIKRNFWIDFEKLDVLSEQERYFVIIQEWLNFEAWEGFTTALHFRFLDMVTNSIKKALNWGEMAENLREAYKKQKEIYLKYQKQYDSVTIHNEYLTEDIEYQKCYQFFRDHEEVFIEKLYDFVKENIRYFP